MNQTSTIIRHLYKEKRSEFKYVQFVFRIIIFRSIVSFLQLSAKILNYYMACEEKNVCYFHCHTQTSCHLNTHMYFGYNRCQSYPNATLGQQSKVTFGYDTSQSYPNFALTVDYCVNSFGILKIHSLLIFEKKITIKVSKIIRKLCRKKYSNTLKVFAY